MNNDEFELFIQNFEKDILRFCRMISEDSESGDELYQDTMLKLLEKRDSLNSAQNAKSYALSISIFLWKNKKRKYAARMRSVPMYSIDEMTENGTQISDTQRGSSPEQTFIRQETIDILRKMVASLPKKYKIPLYLFYSADMRIIEISEILHLPEGTVKSRMRKAKNILKQKLEAIGYDR